MRSVVDRVLAMRMTAQEPGPAPGRAASTVVAARVLALVEPAVAHELLSLVPRPADRLDTASGDTILAEWLQAWALVDPDRAERLFQQILNEQRRYLTASCVQSSLLPMIELLITPPADRIALLAAEQRYPEFLRELPDD